MSSKVTSIIAVSTVSLLLLGDEEIFLRGMRRSAILSESPSVQTDTRTYAVPESSQLHYNSIITSSADSAGQSQCPAWPPCFCWKIGMGFLKRLLSEASCASSLEQLGSSFLFSSLLPATIAQLGPITAKDPKVGR